MPSSSSTSPARKAAFSVLQAVEQPGAPHLDDCIHETFSREHLSPVDKRLFFQIAQGVSRHRLLLDEIIRPFLHGGDTGTPSAVRTALRMGTFQYFFLDRIPEHAIVNETVELVHEADFPKKVCGFANAVMRRILGYDPKRFLVLPPDPTREEIFRRYSIPDWIGEEIEQTYGPNSLVQECAALGEPAAHDFRVNLLKASWEEAADSIADELGIPPERRGDPVSGAIRKGKYAPDSLRLVEGGTDLPRLAAFESGRIAIQDEAAQLVSYWMSARPGMRVADFCSAPGGKTMHLAAQMKNQGLLWGLDADPWRLAKVEDACHRLGVTCVRLGINTPTLRREIRREAEGGLDAVLVDPPCSNLGTIRRHPDVKWRHRASDPESMSRNQRQILEQASGCVRPGGILVYSVCTFTRKETDEVIGEFLRLHPEWRRDIDFVPPAFVPSEWRTALGDWVTQTGRDGIDGFFVSRLRKASGGS